MATESVTGINVDGIQFYDLNGKLLPPRERELLVLFRQLPEAEQAATIDDIAAMYRGPRRQFMTRAESRRLGRMA